MSIRQRAKLSDLEEPWPFLIYLSNVQRVEIPAEDVHNALGYDMDYPQGFIRPTESRHTTLRDDFGSVQDFVQRYANAPLSGSVHSVENTIERLDSRLNREPEFKTTVKRTPTERIIRSSAFRRRVRDIYNSSCAVCGARRRSPQGAPEIEAAHIYPKKRNGSDDLRNGIALCKLHHWAFDVGWFSIAEDYSILVQEAKNQRGYEEFRRLDGQGLRIPEESQLRPHKKLLRAHRTIHGFD